MAHPPPLTLASAPADPTDWRRWWVYQQERFPLVRHGLLIAAFSFSAVTLSAVLRGATTAPALAQYGVAFVGSLGFFLLLRIADEFKDQAEDARYRPYRAVPRGLVTLRELGWLGVGVMGLQSALSWWLAPELLVPLVVTWAWLGLMSREFYVAEWLRRHPFTYMWTHMLIMPLIDIYTSACDWLVVGSSVPWGLKWFLVASFFNGMVIEIGRKLRAPNEEETGVQTYTALWGPRLAVGAWLLALGLTLACVVPVVAGTRAFWPLVGLLCTLGIWGCWHSVQFLRSPAAQDAERFELLSGLWTLALYLGLGLLPLWAQGGWS